jgi:hypothetical protein
VSGESAIVVALQELDAELLPLELPVNGKGEPTHIPAVVYKQIGGGGLYSHDKGPSGFEPLWEFRCWHETYAGAKRLARAVVEAIDTLGMQMTGESDDKEGQTGTPNVVVTASGCFSAEEA